MPYQANGKSVNPVLPLWTINGSYLAYARLSKVERAYLAGDLHLGEMQLVRPTVVQCAYLARVNATYVHWALKRQADRDLIVGGVKPLVAPHARALPTVIEAIPADSVPTDPELTAIAHRVGAERWLAAGARAGL
jgi:hypothetical protein